MRGRHASNLDEARRSGKRRSAALVRPVLQVLRLQPMTALRLD